MHENKILATFGADSLARIRAHLRVVKITQGQVLAEAHQPLEHIYFPHSGIVSYVVAMADGQMIETGMVGRDSVVGGLQALDGNLVPNSILVQGPGAASIIETDKMKSVVDTDPAVRGLLAKHELFMMAQVQQSVGCNASHVAEQRVCRWLARMYDLMGPDFALTQEFMAQMIGVRRTSVSLVAGQLQEAGLITYKRGHLHVVDIEGLRRAACECYATTNIHREQIFDGTQPKQTAGGKLG
jgi:CRP-like cAMP-binding protein